MQLLLKLFGSWVQFFYFSFDRVVLHGHLTFFQLEGNVVAFFRNLLGVPVLSKEVLAKRTQDSSDHRDRRRSPAVASSSHFGPRPRKG